MALLGVASRQLYMGLDVSAMIICLIGAAVVSLPTLLTACLAEAILYGPSLPRSPGCDGDFLHTRVAGEATLLELVMYGFLDPKRR